MMTLEERLWKYVLPEPMSGCWLWDGATQRGYGALVVGSRLDGTRKMMRAHRLSWIVHRGDIPDGLDVCHVCDVRMCINPDHLFLGTRKENIRDAVNKNRLNPWQSRKTHCVRGHELSGDNLRYDGAKRRCRECSKLRTRARRQRIAEGIVT
jgi:HNH endonuclease